MSKKVATPTELNSYISPDLEIFSMKENLWEEDAEWQMADYFKAILKEQGLSSYSDIADLLGFKRASITEMKNGKIFPTEENMGKIADLAKRDQRLALLDLRILKSAAETREVYRSIRDGLIKRLCVAAAALITLIFVNVPNAQAAPKMLHYVKDSVYYGKYQKFMRYIIKLFQQRKLPKCRELLLNF